MSLFSRGRQPGLCSLRFAALLTHLLNLLSKVLLLSLRQLVSVEVPRHVDAEVTCRGPPHLRNLVRRDLGEARDPGREVHDCPRAL